MVSGPLTGTARRPGADGVAIIERDGAMDVEEAARLIRAARRSTSPTGATGCVERVRFVMGRPGDDPAGMVGD